ncbi:hypothetical protein PHLCEN_2v1930 [Hermanssonia centrifuga]|uniref:HTH APSES-type domain-containing protein n=1 Tax=Hermanssonia centrifuga TaxID=98765 RepID=A0A2R6RVJ5_9APHY|nr:hypothetical protein PHLCEN_2v1930 [Hermanssonia centrifuga]
MVESQPDLASKLRRVRGGYLKIQGTWMPYEIALRLSRRVAWPIRHELIPLFGPTFPSTCLSPDQPGYGQVVKPGTGKRRQRRTQQTGISSEPAPDWTVISPAPHPSAGPSRGTLDGPFTYHPRRQFDTERRQQLSQAGAPIELHLPYSNQSYPTSPATTSPSGLLEATPSRLSGSSYPGNTTRFSPYPPQLQSVPLSSHSPHSPYGLEERRGSQSTFQEDIRLPPIQAPSSNCAARRNSVALPSISTLDGLRKGPQDDSAAVLRRLQCIDDDDMDFGVNSSRSNEQYPGAYHTTIPLRPHQM